MYRVAIVTKDTEEMLDGRTFPTEEGADNYIYQIAESRGIKVGWKVDLMTEKRERLEDYMKDKHFKPGEVVIIGDSPEEIEIGRKMGLKSITITDGFFSTKRLKEKKPDHLVKRLDEIIGIIESL